MKKIILFIAMMACAPALFAQNSPLLASYYQLKDDLVKSNSADAAAHAAAFVKVMTATDLPGSKELKDKLLFDARHISESKDIDHQREHFASFTANFPKLAKVVKLSDQPIYVDYCPMKRAYWLSSEEAIKNPYYGDKMLHCGEVKQVLNK